MKRENKEGPLKIIEFKTYKESFVLVEGYLGFRPNGVYCPECDTERPMDGAAHCYVCHAATAYGEFHDEEIEFDDDAYEQDRKPVWELVGQLSEIKISKELKEILDSDKLYFENFLGKRAPVRKDYQKNRDYIDDHLAWQYVQDKTWDKSKTHLYKKI